MIVFSVEGNPRGKQRPRMARRGRRTITYTPQETLEYERRIRESFLLSSLKEELPLRGKLAIEVVAVFPRTKALSFQYKNGTYKHGRERFFHAVKPDADNVLKCVLDGIGDYIEGGDSRVVHAVITKVYAGVDENAGTHIKLWNVEGLSEIDGIDWSKDF